MAESRPPLPPQVRAALVVLGLLCLEAVRALVVFLLNSPSGVFTFTEAGPFSPMYHGPSEYRITDRGAGMGMVLFLIVYLGLGIGLFLRSPLAWWMGLILAGGSGVLQLLFLLPAFHALLEEPNHAILGESFHEPHEQFWTVTRSVLLLFVPALLILAKLRGRLKDWD